MQPSDPPVAKRRARRWVGIGVGLAICVLSGFASPGGAGDVDPAAARTSDPGALASALQDVDSPYFGIRESAVATLRALGAAAKPAVRDAFRSASERVRALLSRVLVSDAEVDDIRLLLDALTTAKDPATASALRIALVEHAEETSTIVASLRALTPSPPAALVQLEDLLARARIEALLLSRKSTSGGTGSYLGQYDVLRVDRKRALDLCIKILSNQDLARPGVFPTGSFRFVRSPRMPIASEELKAMAANAISELCQDDDIAILTELERIHAELEEIHGVRGGFDARAGSRMHMQLSEAEALGLDDIVLTILAIHGKPERRASLARDIADRIQYHQGEGDSDDAAHLLLRMKRYADAVRLFKFQIVKSERKVLPYYNLACAYARWSDETTDAREADAARELAVMAIEQSVRYGYADWPWMEQDRDLDAIRKEPRYVTLRDGLKEKYPPPNRGLRAPPSSTPPGTTPSPKVK